MHHVRNANQAIGNLEEWRAAAPDGTRRAWGIMADPEGELGVHVAEFESAFDDHPRECSAYADRPVAGDQWTDLEALSRRAIEGLS